MACVFAKTHKRKRARERPVKTARRSNTSPTSTPRTIVLSVETPTKERKERKNHKRNINMESVVKEKFGRVQEKAILDIHLRTRKEVL